MKCANGDSMRDRLDQAAVATAGIDPKTVRDWRARISREPTITNTRAKELEDDEVV